MSNTQRCPHCGRAVPTAARFCQGCGGDVTGGKGRSAKTIVSVVAVLIAVGVLAFAGIQLTKPKSEPVAAPAKKERPTQIAGAGQMPMWLLSSDQQVQDDYIWAASHLEELQYIPCYCGCYESAGHTDNYACYFKRDATGKITSYDNHAVG